MKKYRIEKSDDSFNVFVDNSYTAFFDTAAKAMNFINTLQTKRQFEILPNGDLHINLVNFDTDEIEAMQSWQGGYDEDFLFQFYETKFCNGWHFVPAENKGLTEAPMICDEVIDEGTTKEDFESTNMWFFGNYQIESVRDVLLRDGFIVFTKVRN